MNIDSVRVTSNNVTKARPAAAYWCFEGDLCYSCDTKTWWNCRSQMTWHGNRTATGIQIQRRNRRHDPRIRVDNDGERVTSRLRDAGNDNGTMPTHTHTHTHTIVWHSGRPQTLLDRRYGGISYCSAVFIVIVTLWHLWCL